MHLFFARFWVGLGLLFPCLSQALAPFPIEVPYSDDDTWVAPAFDNKFPPEEASIESFSHWIENDSALITAELAHLGLQITLERVREHLDPFAYDFIKTFYEKIKTIKTSTTLADIAWGRLVRFLNPFIDSRFPTAKALTQDCDKAFENLSDKDKQELAFLFGGLLKSGSPSSDPFWKKLKNESCYFVGYSEESPRPEIWKFWMVYRILSHILPKDADSGAFVESLEILDEKTLEGLSKLETYMHWRGKPSGLSIKSALTTKITECNRRTGGRFAGSTAISLLADNSVAWKDNLSSRFSPQNLWSNKKSNLYLDPLFSNLPPTYKGQNIVEPSASFDVGLVFWKHLLELPTFGQNQVYYSKSIGLQWMIGQLNGFSSASHWREVLRWDIDTTVPVKTITGNVYGSPSTYALLGSEYDAAMKAFSPLIEIARKKNEFVWQKIQEGWLKEFTNFKTAAIRVTAEKVEKLPQHALEWWARIQLASSIATLGSYRSDLTKYPEAPDNIQLQIANSGPGSVYEVQLNKKSYRLWSPKTYKILIYSDTPLSPEKWENLLQKAGL